MVHPDGIVCSLLVEAIEKAGGEAFTRGSAPGGAMAMKERRFACLIVDVDLPGRSGFDLLSQSRTLSPPPDAFVVLSEPDTNLVLQALHLGAIDFIAKPFVVAAITNRIRPVLDRFRLAEQTTRAQLLLGGGVYRELLSAVADQKKEAEIAAIASAWAMRLLPAEGACVTRVEGGELVHVAALGITARLRGLRAPIGHTFTGRILQRGRAAFFSSGRMPEDLIERQEWSGMASGLIAPILGEEAAVGTLAVSSTRERVFTRQHMRILMGLARFLSLNLVVARANDLRARFTRQLISAQEADRAHIARELHDEMGQSLTAVLVRLTSLRRVEDPAAPR